MTGCLVVCVECVASPWGWCQQRGSLLPSFCCQGARESDRVSAIIIFSLWPLGPGESFLLVVQYFLISLLGRFYPDHVVEFAPFLLYCMPTFRPIYPVYLVDS